MPSSGEYHTFEECRKWVKTKNFTSLREYRSYVRRYRSRLKYVPSYPEVMYESQWKGVKHFLSDDTVPYSLPFEEAREYARSLKLTSIKSYRTFVEEFEVQKKTDRLPLNPTRRYVNDFINWRDFLGPQLQPPNIYKRLNFLPYYDALMHVHSLKLKNGVEWSEYCKTDKPRYIPARPEMIYEEWAGIKQWLGTDFVFSTKIRMDAPKILSLLYDESNQTNMLDYAVDTGAPLTAYNVHSPTHTYKRMYRLYRGDFELFKEILVFHCPTFDGGSFIPSNYAQFQYDLDANLEIVQQVLNLSVPIHPEKKTPTPRPPKKRKYVFVTREKKKKIPKKKKKKNVEEPQMVQPRRKYLMVNRSPKTYIPPKPVG